MTASPGTIETTNFETLHEIVESARTRLGTDAWNYLIGGSETETTMLRNRAALDHLAFRPRVLRDVTQIDASSELFGRRVRLPVVLAPVGSLNMFWQDGRTEVAKAASQFGAACLINNSEAKAEDMARCDAVTPVVKGYQLYVRGDGGWIDDHVARAIDGGYEVFCITVDTPVRSRRERDITNRFSKPWLAGRTGGEFLSSFNWDRVAELRARHKIRIALKGITTAEDADKACSLGVDVIYLSNHGGRQLDYGRGAIDVLPEVRDAVAKRATIIVDGGFARGSDIVKAMVLGADAVGLGRLYLYGLAANGAQGIVRVLEILEEEVRRCLGLMGATGFSELDASYVSADRAVNAPGLHSPFPLLRQAPAT